MIFSTEFTNRRLSLNEDLVLLFVQVICVDSSKCQLKLSCLTIGFIENQKKKPFSFLCGKCSLLNISIWRKKPDNGTVFRRVISYFAIFVQSFHTAAHTTIIQKNESMISWSFTINDFMVLFLLAFKYDQAVFVLIKNKRKEINQ